MPARSFPFRLLAVAVVLAMAGGGAAVACEAEGSGACDGNDAGEARWMLGRVVASVQRDEGAALQAFIQGANGFRTQDLYVFCMGSDGRMSAHPDPKLMNQDARALRDPSGKAFAAEMMDVAKEGSIAEVSYLFPRPGSTVPVPKTSYVTRVRDQVCGVGFYGGAEAASGGAESPEARILRLQQSLEAGMPEALRPDWTAYLAALRQQAAAKDAAVERARDALKAAETALEPGPVASR